MAFKKGSSGNPKGKPKGTVNKTTKEVKSLVLEFVSNNWEQVQLDFSNKKLLPRDRLAFMERILRYVIPIMGSTRGTIDIKKQLEGLSDQDLDKVVNMVMQRGGNNENEDYEE